MAFIAPSPARANLAKRIHPPCSCSVRMGAAIGRRACLRSIGAAVAAAVLVHPRSEAVAAMYSADTKTDAFLPTGDPSKVSTYMPQIEAGYQALVQLQNNWDAKTRDFDGDVVRRVLGTVGVKSPLFNIRKSFLKAWQIVSQSSDDFDLIDRLESEWNDVLNGISAIDFQLYSVSFTELRESKESLINQAKKALDETVSIYSDVLKDFRSSA